MKLPAFRVLYVLPLLCSVATACTVTQQDGTQLTSASGSSLFTSERDVVCTSDCAGFQFNDCDSVTCSAANSCQASIMTNVANVFCSGGSSCRASTISNADLVECTSPVACASLSSGGSPEANTSIEASTVNCQGENSCAAVKRQTTTINANCVRCSGNNACGFPSEGPTIINTVLITCNSATACPAINCNLNGGGNGSCSAVPVGAMDHSVGVMGDPHIFKWDHQMYNFHGQCDLVSIASKQFGQGQGLDLHIRTTLQDDRFSYVDTVAFRIGNQTAEISVNPQEQLRVNGKVTNLEDLPLPFANGYAALSGGQHNVDLKNGKKRYPFYRIDDNDGNWIVLEIIDGIISFKVKGDEKAFGDAVGLMGEYGLVNTAVVSRAGKVMSLKKSTADWNAAGLEWQVKGDDPRLFHSARAPQWPVLCDMPGANGEATTMKKTQRRLRADDSKRVALAERACSNVPTDLVDACKYDVMATGDANLAESYLF